MNDEKFRAEIDRRLDPDKAGDIDRKRWCYDGLKVCFHCGLCADQAEAETEEKGETEQ